MKSSKLYLFLAILILSAQVRPSSAGNDIAMCIHSCKLLCSVFYEIFDLSWWACVLGCPDKCSGGGGGGGGGGVAPYGDPVFTTEERDEFLVIESGGVKLTIDATGMDQGVARLIRKDARNGFRRLRKAAGRS